MYQGLTYRKGDVYELRDPAVYNPWNNWLRALWWNNWFVVDITLFLNRVLFQPPHVLTQRRGLLTPG